LTRLWLVALVALTWILGWWLIGLRCRWLISNRRGLDALVIRARTLVVLRLVVQRLVACWTSESSRTNTSIRWVHVWHIYVNTCASWIARVRRTGVGLVDLLGWVQNGVSDYWFDTLLASASGVLRTTSAHEVICGLIGVYAGTTEATWVGVAWVDVLLLSGSSYYGVDLASTSSELWCTNAVEWVGAWYTSASRLTWTAKAWVSFIIIIIILKLK
jgi:hypothetical protein